MDPQIKRPPILYKYTSVKSAVAILESRSLRWSHLDDFNDATEVQEDYSAGMNDVEVHAHIIRILEGFIFGDAEIPHVEGGALLNIAREIRAGAFGNERHEIRTKLELLIKSVSVQSSDKPHVENINLGVTKVLERARALCLTECPVSPQMWGTYGDENRGVALGFEADPAQGWMNLVEPVTYVDRPRTFAGPEDWAQVIVFHRTVPPAVVRRNLFYFKSSGWSFEREWRGVYASEKLPVESAKAPLFIELAEVPLVEICFGLRCEPSQRDAVTRAAQTAGYDPKYTAVRKSRTAGLERL